MNHPCDVLTAEDRDAITILLEKKADELSENEIDFLHGIRLRRGLSEAQRGWFEDIWKRVMGL